MTLHEFFLLLSLIVIWFLKYLLQYQLDITKKTTYTLHIKKVLVMSGSCYFHVNSLK